MSMLGSDCWLNADDNEAGSELHTRAVTFVAAIKWDALTSLASQMRGTACHLSENFSLDHFNLVRRIIFADDVSWIVRLRLPELENFFGSREALDVQECMNIEIATINYLRLKTTIPVPEVFGHDLSAYNIVGAPYILMSYIHGTVASEWTAARECGAGVFGTPEQNEGFWQQMASIQVQLASLTFDQIGSLRQGQDQEHFTIGSEIETGEGPWDTPEQYYSALVRHKLQVAEKDADPEVCESESFSLPHKFAELMSLYGASHTGPYSLVNRDFGAHNVLVDEEYKIVGLIDLDGVMAAPAEVVAQFPLYMGLDRPIPGHVETRPFALQRIKKIAPLLPTYVNLVIAAIAEREVKSGTKDISGIADLLMSDAASIMQGLTANGQHQAFVNED